MSSENPVPDVQLLKRFLLGQVSGVEAAQIERYLEQHPDLSPTLAGVGKEDTLIGLLRAAAGKVADDPPELAKLMDKLSRIRPAAVDESVSGDETFSGLAPPQAADEIGRLGGYRVLKILGAGGMGMVYQSEDVHLQRHVTLKVMKPELTKNPIARERFLREARAAAKLKSDHVVTIYHVGDDHHVVFLTMEYLEGMSLEDWLKKGRKATLAQAARMGRQIALGLADAHGRGLMHRDIKPGNIWLESTHQGRVKLLDFGLARGEHEDVQLTQSGAIVGTPAYMAPEQARGAKVDHRADLFSLGVVLYRLTTGRLPFRGDNTMSILTALALDTPTPPRQINADISPRMATLIERLLSKDREQRPQTAKAVADELAAIERPAPVSIAVEPTELIIPVASVVSERLVSSAPSRSRLFTYVVAASLLVWLGGMAAAIVIIIRDKDGKKVAEVPVPPGGSFEVKDKNEAKKPPTPKMQVRIEPEPLAPMKDGEPLSQFAFVRQPTKLPGVRSWTIARREAEITSLAWSPDGKHLASTAAGEKRVLIWDAAKGERDRELGPFDGAAESVKWSADGRLLTFNVPEVGWHVWDVKQNKLVNDPKQWKLFWFDLSPDGRSALVAPKEKEVYRLRDLASGKYGVQLPHAHNIYLAHPTWSADGTILAVAVYSSGIELRRPDLSKCLRTLPLTGSASLITFTRDGKWVAALNGERLFVWETVTGRLCGLLVMGRRNNALTISPEGHYTGNENVDSGIVMVVEKDDGTQEMLEPAEFKKKYRFKNDPNKVHLRRYGTFVFAGVSWGQRSPTPCATPRSHSPPSSSSSSAVTACTPNKR